MDIHAQKSEYRTDPQKTARKNTFQMIACKGSVHVKPPPEQKIER
jgi:hypothetical protein